MSIEIREDSQYTFTYEKIRSDLPQLITEATITIFSNTGETILEETSMSVTSNVASYNIDLSAYDDFELGTNYRVQYDIDGEVISYFFSVVKCPFVNPVDDQDLVNENPIVRKGVWEAKGQADSGTFDTIVDTERTEAYQHWYGGVIEILPLDDANQITKHQINDYDNTINTITFTPTRSTAVTTENYVIRRSYQAQINLAGEKVAEDLWKNDKRIYLLLDSTQAKRLIIYKFFETYFQGLRDAEGDKQDLQFKYYLEKYNAEIASLKFDYDANEDGVIDDSEKGESLTSVEIIR